MIHIIRTKCTPEQMQEMLATLGIYVKVAVDVRRRILAGGGAMHADCKSELLEDGSQQEDVWGADWIPADQTVAFESLINIRPRQGNRKIEIEDPVLRSSIEQIVRNLMGAVPHA
jgi:hypothetical protein